MSVKPSSSRFDSGLAHHLAITVNDRSGPDNCIFGTNPSRFESLGSHNDR